VDGTKLAGINYLSFDINNIRISSELKKIYRKNAWGGLPIRWGGPWGGQKSTSSFLFKTSPNFNTF